MTRLLSPLQRSERLREGLCPGVALCCVPAIRATIQSVRAGDNRHRETCLRQSENVSAYALCRHIAADHANPFDVAAPGVKASVIGMLRICGRTRAGITSGGSS